MFNCILCWGLPEPRGGLLKLFAYLGAAYWAESAEIEDGLSADSSCCPGDWSFSVAAARAWNALPQHVRNAPSLLVFRWELKTVLFQSSLCDLTMYCALSARPSLSANLSPCTGCYKLISLTLYGGPAAAVR